MPPLLGFGERLFQDHVDAAQSVDNGLEGGEVEDHDFIDVYAGDTGHPILNESKTVRTVIRAVFIRGVYLFFLAVSNRNIQVAGNRNDSRLFSSLIIAQYLN